MREIGDSPRTRWSMSAQHPDGRVSVEWVHDGCIEVDDQLYAERIGKQEDLATP